MRFFEAVKKGCNSNCPVGRTCLQRISIDTIGTLITQFWGDRKEPPKNPSQRAESIDKLFFALKARVTSKVRTI